jgi:hypothetical protein
VGDRWLTEGRCGRGCCIGSRWRVVLAHRRVRPLMA